MVLSYQSLKKLIGGAVPMIRSDVSLDCFLQPASLDLPVSDICYRVCVSTAPTESEKITDLLRRFKKYEFELKPEGALLERGMTYILPLAVSLDLSKEFRASFSSKSTTGRNDLITSHLSNYNPELNTTVFGYEGSLYIEVTPLSWDVIIYPHRPLTQMRLHSVDDNPLTCSELAVLHSQYGIVRNENGEPTKVVIGDGALYLHLNLTGDRVGHESIVNPEAVVHIGQKEVDTYSELFRPIRTTRHDDIILHPDSFYLLPTKERIFIPPTVCAVMEQYSTSLGEFSSHEAGFFDNNFGGQGGTQGVLEIHVNKRKAIRVWDGRPICRMVFYKTDEIPEVLYDSGTNHYIGSGPSLQKNIIGYRQW